VLLCESYEPQQTWLLGQSVRSSQRIGRPPRQAATPALTHEKEGEPSTFWSQQIFEAVGQ
jgi:hypothetical protein